MSKARIHPEGCIAGAVEVRSRVILKYSRVVSIHPGDSTTNMVYVCLGGRGSGEQITYLRLPGASLLGLAVLLIVDAFTFGLCGRHIALY